MTSQSQAIANGTGEEETTEEDAAAAEEFTTRFGEMIEDN